jgi:hypothetical protein
MSAETVATPGRLSPEVRGMAVRLAGGVVCVGFLAHGGWDWLHHGGHGPARVRTWYPPFCVVVDVVTATPLLAGWVP